MYLGMYSTVRVPSFERFSLFSCPPTILRSPPLSTPPTHRLRTRLTHTHTHTLHHGWMHQARRVSLAPMRALPSPRHPVTPTPVARHVPHLLTVVFSLSSPSTALPPFSPSSLSAAASRVSCPRSSGTLRRCAGPAGHGAPVLLKRHRRVSWSPLLALPSLQPCGALPERTQRRRRSPAGPRPRSRPQGGDQEPRHRRRPHPRHQLYRQRDGHHPAQPVADVLQVQRHPELRGHPED